MNIALIPGTFFPHPGGAQVQIHNLANKLDEKKIDVDCYLFKKTNLTCNHYKIFLLNRFILNLVFLFHYYLRIDIKFILRIYLKKIISKKSYDLWHLNFINYKSLILIDCLKNLNQKILVTFQGIDIQLNEEIGYGYRLDKKYESYLKKMLNNIDLFSCLSNTIKDDLLRFNVQENKITMIPNAVELDKFNEFKKNKDLNKKRINLITVARFSEKKKGFDLLPELASKLINSKIDFNWTIIGKNTNNLFDHEVIKKNSKYFSIFDDLINYDEKYLPNSELIKKYISSDLYVNLSRIESFGITFVEALASGVPVVSFNTKGVNEIIYDQHNGFIVKEMNIEHIHDLVVKVYNDTSLLKKLDEGIKDSCKQYDLNLVTNKFIDAYKNLKKI